MKSVDQTVHLIHTTPPPLPLPHPHTHTRHTHPPPIEHHKKLTESQSLGYKVRLKQGSIQ